MKTLSKLTLAAYKERYRTQREIDRLQLEVEAIEVEMSGLGHHGDDLSPEQERSSKPMPHTVSPTYNDQKLLTLIERKDEINKQIDYLVMSMNLVRRVELMNTEDQKMMFDLYHGNQRATEVAKDHGYSVQGMYKRIQSELDRLT